MKGLVFLFSIAAVVAQDDEDSNVPQYCTSHVDYTTIPGMVGQQVVAAVHTKLVDHLHIDDRGFMTSYAFVETQYGTKVFDRYEMQQQIWAISRQQFLQTQEHYMKAYTQAIYASFGVEWENMLYEEMNVPLYSGIAFHLYLISIDAYPIGWSSVEQGTLYTQITGQATIQWTTYTTILINIQEALCAGKETDLVFLVDESGSIGATNFQKMMDFVANVIEGLDIGADGTRVAIRTFSDPDRSTNNDLHVSLSNSLSKANLMQLARDVPYDCDRCRTFTDTGIASVLDVDFQLNAGMRQFSKKILVVVTDGESTEPAKTIVEATRLHMDDRNIQALAIGVSGANVTELGIIASAPDQVYFLDDFASFDYVQDQIITSICNAPILSSNGEIIVGMVSAGTSVTDLEAIIGGNVDLGGGAITTLPGYATFELTMAGRTLIKMSAGEAIHIYLSYTHTTPSTVAYDYHIEYVEAMALAGVEVDLKVVMGTEKFYISAYNYGDASSRVLIDIQSDTISALDPLIIPILCGKNAKCITGGSCACNEGYYGNPYTGCNFDFCASKVCEGGAICNSNTGACECREGYAWINGLCQSPLCPDDAIIATENQYGYAMGLLSSPFYGKDNYPTFFDCEYNVEAPRAEGSCYELHIEAPFELETSRSCRNDRLEIFNLLNAADVNMDSDAPANVGVLCGNACIAEGGWIGRICSQNLKLRFKSDDIITGLGWKVKWILRPKEDCDCWC